MFVNVSEANPIRSCAVVVSVYRVTSTEVTLCIGRVERLFKRVSTLHQFVEPASDLNVLLR